MGFQEHDVVRIVRLMQPERHFSGTAGEMRAPRVGDVATIVHLPVGADGCIVECVDPGGRTVWLAEFLLKELELVQAVEVGDG